jgi:hypothetical protein
MKGVRQAGVYVSLWKVVSMITSGKWYGFKATLAAQATSAASPENIITKCGGRTTTFCGVYESSWEVVYQARDRHAALKLACV